MGEMITLNGDAAGAYLSAPAEGAGLGVIVVAGEQGINDHIKAVCDRLAEEGFTALAPAFAGEGGVSVAGVVDQLLAHQAVRGRGIAVVGFGDGAGVALRLGIERSDAVRAVIPFYDTVETAGPELDWSQVTAAVEAHYAGAGDTGQGSPAGHVDENLAALGRDVRVFHYPGTKPGFFDETRKDVYDDDAARQAWVRTLEFLRAKLG